MNCQSCGYPVEYPDNRYCENCGSLLQTSTFDYGTFGPSRYLMNENKKSLNLGIIALTLFAISFFVYGFLSFFSLGLSIYGLSIVNRNTKRGTPHSGAFTVNLIALILSAIGSLIMLLYFIF